MKLFKMCVQSKREAAFNFHMIDKYCTPKMFHYENVCSKQELGGCSMPNVILQKSVLRASFLIYLAPFLVRKMCVQNNWMLLFSLFKINQILNVLP